MNFSAPKILEKMVWLDASDLHLTVGSPPVVRIKRNLSPLSDFPSMSIEDVNSFLQQVLEPDQVSILEVSKELDFSISLGSKARFRVNAFYQKGYPSVALRYILQIIPTLAELRLPPILGGLANVKQGLILVVGPAGHGKSTTIASILDQINQTRAEHIITLEDPIEYIFVNKKSLIEQRELYVDTASWDNALKSILRQDPDVVFIGEMRDADTTLSALRIAETGHLVFATLHTNSAAQTVERIVSTFPPDKQNGFQSQLSSILEAVISLRLLPAKDGGVQPAVEIMLGTDAIRNIIREGKYEQINNVINTSSPLGMTSLDRSLAALIEKGVVEPDEALRYALNPDQVRRYLK
jgi:twitching motility protein PilT